MPRTTTVTAFCPICHGLKRFEIYLECYCDEIVDECDACKCYQTCTVCGFEKPRGT